MKGESYRCAQAAQFHVIGLTLNGARLCTELLPPLARARVSLESGVAQDPDFLIFEPRRLTEGFVVVTVGTKKYKQMLALSV